MNARLPTHFMVDALIKRAHCDGSFATIAHAGDDDRGTVFLRVIVDFSIHALIVPDHSFDGIQSYRYLNSEKIGTDPHKIEAYIQSQINLDPDIWVIDIEGSKGAHFLTAPVKGMEAFPKAK